MDPGSEDGKRWRVLDGGTFCWLKSECVWCVVWSVGVFLCVSQMFGCLL